MNWWHRLLRRDKMEDELEKELRFHLDQHTDDLVAKGQTSDEALRYARLAIGGPEQVKEKCRDARGTRWLLDLVYDLRFGARMLAKKPGFAFVSILTLALGIGASTAIFSAVNPILFEPLPYPHANRIMTIWYAGKDGSRATQTFGTYQELLNRSRSFEALAVMKLWQPTMTGPSQPVRFEGQSVSASYFNVLGVMPAIGRNFDSADDRLNGPKVVILSNVLWRNRFNSDAGIVGRQITLDDDLYTVVGVMPNGFEDVLSSSAELWSPLQYDMSQNSAWGHHLRMIGRLRPAVSTDPARNELNQIASSSVPEFPRRPWASMSSGLIVSSLQDDITSGIKPALLAVIGAVLLVLMIACVNVTNLLLARGAQRSGEFAMRAALGAGRTRLIRQLLTESLMLALIGGALGIAIADIGVRALVALSPAELPRLSAITVDGQVLVFALGISTTIGLIVGLVPAVSVSRNDLHAGIQQGSRRAAGGGRLTRRVLVVAEVALAMVLLVSAGLLLHSLQRLFSIDPGFDSSHLLTMQVQTSGRKFDKGATDRFFQQSLESVRRLPGVTAAAFTSQLPLSGDDDEYGARFEGDDPNLGYNVFRYAVSPGYIETVGIPLRRGRLLDARDTSGATLAVLISESLAQRRFPGQDPIGQRVHIGPTNLPWYTIAGVVGDVKQASLAANQPDAVYITTTQSWFVDNPLSLVVKTSDNAAALAPAIKEAIWSVDKDQPITRVATMDDLLARSESGRRFALFIFEAFAIVSLVLAATGIYGVLSGSVTERIREIGVRMALGATRGNVLALVVRQGMTLTVVGVLIGLAGTIAATKAVVTLLFGISRLDPVTYLGVVALLLVASAIACWVPAWRASRVDPAITLRAE